MLGHLHELRNHLKSRAFTSSCRACCGRANSGAAAPPAARCCAPDSCCLLRFNFPSYFRKIARMSWSEITAFLSGFPYRMRACSALRSDCTSRGNGGNSRSLPLQTSYCTAWVVFFDSYFGTISATYFIADRGESHRHAEMHTCARMQKMSGAAVGGVAATWRRRKSAKRERVINVL